MSLKKLDFTYLLLSILLLVSTFFIFNFYQIDKKIDTFQNYRSQLDALKVLDKEFDNFVLHQYTYANYDKINLSIQQFEATLNELQKSEENNFFGQQFQLDLKQIQEDYHKKIAKIEHFKALNSASVNSLSYLLDLKASISKESSISQKDRRVINKLAYKIMQLSLDINPNHQQMLTQLKSLQGEHKYLKFFILHTKLFLNYTTKLSKNQQELAGINLDQDINQTSDDLRKIYLQQMREIRIITSVFFTSIIIMLLLLTIVYSRSKKTARSLHLAAAVFENTKEGILITDKDSKILSANQFLEDLTGYSKEELIGQRASIFQSTKHPHEFYQDMWKEIANTGRWQGRILNQHKDNSTFPVWLSITAIKDNQGQVSNYISTQTDLREIIQSQEKIEHLAYHDALTNLANRVSFENHFKHALKMAQRNRQRMALLFIDLNRFKDINDTLGHHVGDKLLIEVSKRIQSILRDSDLLARIGGDEFMVALENISHNSNASNTAKKILDILEKNFLIDEYELTTSASIGISFYPDDSQDFHDLLKFSDSAMYKAKELGKNTFAFYDASLYESVTKKLSMEKALRSALKSSELYLNYQPQYNLQSKKVESAEALIRWNNPKFGQVPPDEFIPIAEDSGLIIDIGYFVFEAACRFLSQLRSSGLELKLIAINLSSNQFKDALLVDKFSSILARYHLKASDIEIEITERYMMQDNNKNLQIMQRLQNQGYSISIDDFGTGYSSMSYLKTFPIDIIKIDKSFVDNIPNDANDVAITKAILALCSSLGYDNVAEGIETAEQEEFLRKNDCKFGQGYYFSKPLSEDDFTAFLTDLTH